jgi:hypothetical protein
MARQVQISSKDIQRAQQLRDQASIALSDSIEKVFEEKAVAQKIMEVLSAQ